MNDIVRNLLAHKSSRTLRAFLFAVVQTSLKSPSEAKRKIGGVGPLVASIKPTESGLEPIPLVADPRIGAVPNRRHTCFTPS